MYSLVCGQLVDGLCFDWAMNGHNSVLGFGAVFKLRFYTPFVSALYYLFTLVFKPFLSVNIGFYPFSTTITKETTYKLTN